MYQFPANIDNPDIIVVVTQNQIQYQQYFEGKPELLFPTCVLCTVAAHYQNGDIDDDKEE